MCEETDMNACDITVTAPHTIESYIRPLSYNLTLWVTACDMTTSLFFHHA
jgi:hypothetical protein